MTNTLDKRTCGCTEACKMVGFLIEIIQFMTFLSA